MGPDTHGDRLGLHLRPPSVTSHRCGCHGKHGESTRMGLRHRPDDPVHGLCREHVCRCMGRQLFRILVGGPPLLASSLLPQRTHGRGCRHGWHLSIPASGVHFAGCLDSGAEDRVHFLRYVASERPGSPSWHSARKRCLGPAFSRARGEDRWRAYCSSVRRRKPSTFPIPSCRQAWMRRRSMPESRSPQAAWRSGDGRPTFA
jgi:hypothetical protein